MVACPDCSTCHSPDAGDVTGPVHLECARCGARFLPTAATRRAARLLGEVAWRSAMGIRLERTGVALVFDPR